MAKCKHLVFRFAGSYKRVVVCKVCGKTLAEILETEEPRK
jgi:ribosomal protein S27E